MSFSSQSSLSHSTASSPSSRSPSSASSQSLSSASSESSSSSTPSSYTQTFSSETSSSFSLSYSSNSPSSNSPSSNSSDSTSSLSSESLSSESDSSISESFSSTSSADIVQTGKSSLVFQVPVLTPERGSWAATLDIDAIDSVKVKSTAWHYIDMSGTYAGYVVKAYRIKVEDGAQFVAVIRPRRSSLQERDIINSWQNSLLGKVRAALTEIRSEYDASMNPGGLPQGNLL